MSNLVAELEELFKEFTGPDNTVILPGILTKLIGKDRIETVISAPQDICLRWVDQPVKKQNEVAETKA